MGPLISLFSASGATSSRFRNQSGQSYLHLVLKPEWTALFALGRGIHVTCCLRFTSGVTPANLLAASMAAKPVSSTYLRADVGGAADERSADWAMPARLLWYSMLTRIKNTVPVPSLFLCEGLKFLTIVLAKRKKISNSMSNAHP